MKTQQLPIIFICSLILFTACKKEIQFNADLISSKMVVNSFIEPDSIINVIIAGSKPIPGVVSNFHWIGNATVKLFVDGEEKETLGTYTTIQNNNNSYNPSYNVDTITGYRSVLKAEIGKTYQLVITHPDYETVTCETNIPKPVEIISIDTSSSVDEGNYYNPYYRNLKVALKFKDPANEINYYRLVACAKQGRYSVEYNRTNNVDTVIVVSNSYFSLNDPIINPNEEDANDFLFDSPGNRYNVFTDELIDGKEYTVNFDITTVNPSPTDTTSLEGKGQFYNLTFILQTLTRESYLFLKSSYEHQYYDGDPFAEPVQVFTNVENGIGIFAGCSSKGKTYTRGTYPIDGIEYRYSDYYYSNYSY